MTVFLVDLEAVESRYTGQWKTHVPELLAADGHNVVVVDGPTDIPAATTPGAFLNFGGTNIYKARQVEEMGKLFTSGRVANGDHFLFTDAWHPGIINLKYMAELLGIKVKIHALWHAGSYDPQDFLGRLIGDAPWVRHAEKSFFHAIDHNYFATDFHIKLFYKNLLNNGSDVENPYYDEDLEYGINNKKILEIMRDTPRHIFMDEALSSRAYEDTALPIGYNQTISQPYTVAYMTTLLVERSPSGKVLEIGTGSGYQSAILDALGYSVYTIERIFELYERAEKLFSCLGLNIACRCGDGTLGWVDEAPFDGIVVTAGAPEEPESLKHQLGEHGCMVIPVGNADSQQMTVITSDSDDFRREVFQQFTFVPLVGREGWNDNIF